MADVSERALKSQQLRGDFQADDEGSIPFTPRQCFQWVSDCRRRFDSDNPAVAHSDNCPPFVRAARGSSRLDFQDDGCYPAQGVDTLRGYVRDAGAFRDRARAGLL
jgi:hypothetical protein